MARETELIFRATDPSLPATQQLAASLEDFEFASSRARISGAAASGAFILVLEALAQDGSIMVQSRIDQEFAVGDTVAASWAPFLRRTPPATSSAAAIPGFHAYKSTDLVCGSGNNARLNWDEWTIDGGTTYFQEGTLVGATLSDVKLMLAGWYAIEAWAWWVSDPAAGFAGIAMVHDDTDVNEPRAAQGVAYPMNWSSSAGMAFQQVRYFPADFTETQTFAFVNRLEFWVIQNSGVNRTIEDAYCNIAYLGARLP